MASYDPIRIRDRVWTGRKTDDGMVILNIPYTVRAVFITFLIVLDDLGNEVHIDISEIVAIQG